VTGGSSGRRGRDGLGGGLPGLEAWARHAAVMRFVAIVLDRRDRRGRFPSTITYRTTEPGLEGLERFLPPLAMRAKADGRVVVDLRRVQALLDDEANARIGGAPPTSLEELFDALAGREPRDRSEEDAAWTRAARARIEVAIAEGQRRAARAGVAGRALEDAAAESLARRLLGEDPDDDRDHRRLLEIARKSGFEQLVETVARLVAGFRIVRAPRRGTMRLDLLSIAVAGDTKALRPETSDYARLVDALARASDELPDDSSAELPIAARPRRASSKQTDRRLLLERYGIVPNDAPLDVIVAGPLALEIDGHKLRDIATLAARGLPSKLGYAVIRACRPSVPVGTRVLSVENESAFHLLARREPRALCVFTAGQASWPVVLLLRKLAAANREVSFAHAGDLDRSGLLILRSLREKTGADIRPLWMDAATFDLHRDAAIEMTVREHAAVRRLRDTWAEPFGDDLLDALAESGRWIEQEAVLARL